MSAGITHMYKENGIHHIVWHDVDPATIETYLLLFREIMENYPQNSILCILHDYRNASTPSFGTLARGMKGLVVRDDVTLRIAHLYSEGLYPTIVKNATLVARFNANRKFFNADEEDRAIAWLLDLN